MIILGAGVNHWYHMDMNYRGMINMLIFCGCVGQSGGGWAHYVGQENCAHKPAGCPGLCARLEPTTAPDEQHLVSTIIPANGAMKKSLLRSYFHRSPMPVVPAVI